MQLLALGLISYTNFAKADLALKTGSDLPLVRYPQFAGTEWEFQVFDNDQIANDVINGIAIPIPTDDDLVWDIDARGKFYVFEDAMNAITPQIESIFDYYLLINTYRAKTSLKSAPQHGSSKNLPPAQHFTLVARSKKDEPIFTRNNGAVNGITEHAKQTQADFFAKNIHDRLTESIDYYKKNISSKGLTGRFLNKEVDIDVAKKPIFVPISSGIPGNGGISTFSGAFQLNLGKTQTGLSKKFSAPMSFAIYFKTYYEKEKRESGAAIHGTPPSLWTKLGTPASHGCARTFPPVANGLRDVLFLNKNIYSTGLPAFVETDGLLTPNGKVQTQAVPRVLVVLFQGYEVQVTA